MHAAELDAGYRALGSGDTYDRAQRLAVQAESILDLLVSFRDKFKPALPQSALDAIDTLDKEAGPHLRRPVHADHAQRRERTWFGLVALGAVETELSFLLADAQESLRALSERAFSHLQRSLVVDATLRKRWRDAFDRGLLHGIWAFKGNAEGERTDLVYQERVDLAAATRSSEGLVLTEWKKATSDGEAQSKFRDAHMQARLYARGILAGTELTRVRYLVVVSERRVSMPDDPVEGGVVYRHINIAIEPDSPSRDAARRPKRRG
jgi:hypothetical protein